MRAWRWASVGTVFAAWLAACSTSYTGAPEEPADAGPDTASPPKEASVEPNVADTGASCDVLSPPATTVRAVTIGFEVFDAAGTTPDGWRTLGWDRDGLCTVATSLDVCQPSSGAAATNQIDGDRGTDNSFGKNIVPIIRALSANVTFSGFLKTDANGNGTLTMGFDGLRMDVPVVGAKVQVNAASATFSGVLPTEPLVASFARAAARYSTSFCSGATIESAKQQLRQASDIGKDGTQSPAMTCDGITVGAILTGVKMAEAPPDTTPDPCKD